MGRLRRGEKVREGSPFDFDPDQPPHVSSCLAHRIVSVYRRKLADAKIPWPSEVPVDPLGAARWWMGNQKPCTYEERPRLANCAQQDGGQRWELPYFNRLAITLQDYLRLPDDEREVVLAARADNVWWNGDAVKDEKGGPGLFLRVYDETMKARQCSSILEYLKQRKTRELAAKTLKRMPV